PHHSTLFPYTTLFRSDRSESGVDPFRQQLSPDQTLTGRGIVSRQAPEVDGEAVVLGGDLDPVVHEAAHGMVAAVVAEGQLEGGGDRKSTRLNSSHVKI